MYCTNCGTQRAASANFCGNCGTRHGATEDALPVREPINQSPQIFHNEGGFIVNEVVFSTEDGASYPIRNITSVVVKPKPTNPVTVVLAVLLILLGMLFGMAGKNLIFVAVILFVLSIPFWYVIHNRPYMLLVGAGGVLQIAVEGYDKEPLEVIACAVNNAVAKIQQGTP